MAAEFQGDLSLQNILDGHAVSNMLELAGDQDESAKLPGFYSSYRYYSNGYQSVINFLESRIYSLFRAFLRNV